MLVLVLSTKPAFWGGNPTRGVMANDVKTGLISCVGTGVITVKQYVYFKNS
ncbi:hypothetical protein FORC22_1915 [Vibrio parahaemolyticus]|nr:hypothetical protein FORC22_1915 [Vibrio parahaemolyticus]